MKIAPLRNYLVVKQSPKPTMSPGGIILLPAPQDRSEAIEGTVVAVGPGDWKKNGKRDSMWGIQPGDAIVFSPNGNAQVEIDGQKLVMIRRDAVIGAQAQRKAA